MSEDLREQIVKAAYRCIAAFGIQKTSVEDIARAAGCSRATIYRIFVGGKDELMLEAARHETQQFFVRLAHHVGDETSLRELLIDGLMWAHVEIKNHEVLNRLLAHEPEVILPVLTVDAQRVSKYVKWFLGEYLAKQSLRPGIDFEAASSHLARMVLSFMTADGGWNLEDRAVVEELVDTQLLGGLLE